MINNEVIKIIVTLSDLFITRLHACS